VERRKGCAKLESLPTERKGEAFNRVSKRLRFTPNVGGREGGRERGRVGMKEGLRQARVETDGEKGGGV